MYAVSLKENGLTSQDLAQAHIFVYAEHTQQGVTKCRLDTETAT